MDVKYPWAFGLDVNNGIVALNYGSDATPPTMITRVTYAAGVGATITFQTFEGRQYQVQYKNALTDAVWTDVGSPVNGSGPTASVTDSTATGAATRFYHIQSL